MTDTKTWPEDWAIAEVKKRVLGLQGCSIIYIKTVYCPQGAIAELARMIEKYEEKPRDPDEVAVESILRAWYSNKTFNINGFGYHLDNAVAEYKRLKTQ